MSERTRQGAPAGGPEPAPAGPREAGRTTEREAPALPGDVRQFPGEVDGPKGPEPTRFGDWEKAGRCTDF